MSRRKAIDESRDTRDVCAALERAPGLIAWRQNGTSHRVYVGPRGSVAVPVSEKELRRGTWRSIIRQAALAGLAVLVIAAMLAVAL